MEKKETNKVTKTAKMEAKTTSRGEKCLAKFTAANGNVYGSLTLDMKRQLEDDNAKIIITLSLYWSIPFRFLLCPGLRRPKAR